MKKFLTILIAFMLFLPFTFLKTEAKPSGAEKYNVEINYIVPDECDEVDLKTAMDDYSDYYPYTPVNGDLLVFASGTTTGTYKCLQFNNTWSNGSVVEKTIAQLQAALANGTHIAVFGEMYHVHGLETVDTSDDIYYDQVFTSDLSNLSSGNYYLAEDVTLENDIYISESNIVRIDLCGHVLNVNGHYIKSYGELTIESCKNTAHKFTVNADGTYTWNEASGTVTLKGGLITGEWTSKKDETEFACIYAKNRFHLDNIVFAGTKDNSLLTIDDEESAFIYTDCIDFTMNNCKVYGNKGAAKRVAYFLSLMYAGDIKNSEFKYNNYDFDGAVMYCEGSDGEILDNVVMTDNITLGGAVWARYTVNLKNKVVITNNYDRYGNQSNFSTQGAIIVLDSINTLTSDSIIGISFMNGVRKNVVYQIVDCNNPAINWKSHFKLDNEEPYFMYIDSTNPELICVANYISQDPSTGNSYTFVLNDEGMKGYDVSYQWKKCDITEIIQKTGSQQDYVDTQFTFHNSMSVNAKFEDGCWNAADADSYIGLVLDLKKGDILYVTSTSSFSFYYLTKAPNYMADLTMSANGRAGIFEITETGRYGIAIMGSDVKYYILHPTTEVKGQTTKSFTSDDPGMYVCVATYKKSGKVARTSTSTPVEVSGKSVEFVVPDSTIYVPTIDFVKVGSTITRPEDPSSIKVIGWYKEPELTNEWDFDNDVVADNMTLYAKYQPNIDISIRMILVNQAKADCIVTVGEGLQLTLDNFYSFTLNGTTYLKSELDFIDPLDETKGYTNGTFTVEAGCIKITLPQDYINTFGLGTYDVSVQLTGMLNSESVEGMVLSDTIQVVDKLPATGVETNNSLFEFVALTSIACAACYIVLQKKHN